MMVRFKIGLKKIYLATPSLMVHSSILTKPRKRTVKNLKKPHN